MITIHEKAIRLIEGGFADADGHRVKLGEPALIYDPFLVSSCYGCKMDCLCHEGTEMFDLCVECDSITGKDCYLTLAE